MIGSNGDGGEELITFCFSEDKLIFGLKSLAVRGHLLTLQGRIFRNYPWYFKFVPKCKHDKVGRQFYD